MAPYGLWGVSDGGAHTKFITLGAYPTESMIDFVRERNLVTLEEAHWRLSALPARAPGSGIGARWWKARRPTSSSTTSRT